MPEIFSSSDSEQQKSGILPRSAPELAKKRKVVSDLWKQPVDLTPELAARLLHGLAENHRRRLEVFVRGGERVSMHDLLAVTGDSDLRVLSYFQGALSRKLRRLLGDRESRIHLIGWDYASTQWDKKHAKIVDGICYVTKTTRESLEQCLGNGPEANPHKGR